MPLSFSIISVANTGSIPNNYFLTQSGEAAKFSTLSENAFFLEPGQTRQVTDYIKVSCDNFGTYKLGTKITTQFKKEKVIEQNVNIQRCDNIYVEANTPLEQSICAGKSTHFDFTIYNTGSFAETYNFAIDRNDIATISQYSTLLQPKESREISVVVNTEKVGAEQLTFFAQSNNNKKQVNADIKLNALACIESGVEIDLDKTNTIKYR